MSGIYLLTLAGVDGKGNTWENVLHFQLNESGAGTGADYCVALINSWMTANAATFLACHAVDTILQTVSAKKINPTGSLTIVMPQAEPGTGPATSFASAIGGLIEFVPEDGWPHSAKVFLASAPVGWVIEGVVQVAYETAIIAFADALATNLVLDGGLGTAIYGLWSKKTAIFHATIDNFFKAVVSSLSKRLRPNV